MTDTNHRATSIDNSRTMTSAAVEVAPGSHPEDREEVGHQRHPWAANMVRVSVAETVGTFMLVLTIIGTAIGATLARPVAGAPYGSLAVPLAGGIVLAIAVASLGHLSGAHLNPAVTVGLALNRRFPWRYVPAYIAAQFVGAVAAALAAWVFYGDQARSVAYLGATYPAAGMSVVSVFAVEAVVTFMLVLVITSVATDSRAQAAAAAMAIGAALAAAIFVSGPISGAGVNPARAIGPMIVAGKFTDWWVYLVAPIVGGVAAATVYDRFMRTGRTPTSR
jgi:MIP family channel proteins